MKTKNLIPVAFVLFCLTLEAQNVKQATWSATLGGTVGNVYNSQLNVPLVQIGSSLTALEPTTGAVLWKSQFVSSLSKIEPIEGTPFSLVEESMSTETLLLNLSDGKTINIRAIKRRTA